MKPNTPHYQTILVIDTTDREVSRLGLIRPRSTAVMEEPVRAQELQKLIVDLLDQEQVSFNELQAVAVLIGPGSYTGIRIGATAANTLRWLYKMPLIEITDTEFETALEQLAKGHPFSTTTIIKPTY